MLHLFTTAFDAVDGSSTQHVSATFPEPQVAVASMGHSSARPWAEISSDLAALNLLRSNCPLGVREFVDLLEMDDRGPGAGSFSK